MGSMSPVDVVAEFNNNFAPIVSTVEERLLLPLLLFCLCRSLLFVLVASNQPTHQLRASGA